MTSRSQPILVLTNDDGVDAPGMHALRQAAGALGQCRVIAPCGPISGCGHQVTTHAPIKLSPRGGDILAVSGTPVDCVRLAIHSLATDVSWVISGINQGGNLGTDVHISGTVAAVREAAIRGVPGIAVSQYVARGRELDWARAARLDVSGARDPDGPSSRAGNLLERQSPPPCPRRFRAGRRGLSARSFSAAAGLPG